MGWIRLFTKISLLFKVASFKARVKRAQQRGARFFVVIVFVLTILLIWFGRNVIISAIDNYRYEKWKEKVPAAEPFEVAEAIDILTSDIPLPPSEDVDLDVSIAETGSEFDTSVFEINIAQEKNLAVPFTPQAPHANWDLPYQEACEEASVYMAAQFFAGDERAVIPKDEADKALLELVDWQVERFGFYEDTNVSKVLNILKHYYGLEYQVINDPTVEVIKESIARGHPVIVPAYGKALPNPFFSGDGPEYHMLVVKGYLEDRFIVNDPGTRRGADFTYEFDHFMPAIHDFNGGDVKNGKSVVIVVTGLAS